MTQGQSFRQSRHAATPAPAVYQKTFVDEMPSLMWANRWELQEVTDDGEPIRRSGWVFKRGEHPEMDAAAKQIGLEWFTYKHRGGGASVAYWHLKAAHFYFAITGVLSGFDMEKNLAARTGFAYARMNRGTGNTALKIVAFCEELFDAGLHQPISIQVKKRMAFQHMMGALTDHYRALKKFAELRGDANNLPAYYEVATALIPGKAVPFGTKETSLGVPIVSGLPTDITREYLLEHYIGRKHRPGLFDAIEEPGDDGTILIDDLLDWAVNESERIYNYAETEGDEHNSVAGSNGEARSYLAGRGRPQSEDELI